MTTAADVEDDKRGFFADRALNWGLLASALLHVVGVAVAGLWFSDARSFEEAQEAIPIEVVTQDELNQVTMGEKEAPAAQKPAIRAEREAPRVVKPEKPADQPEERDVPTPPPPPVRQAAPAEPPVPTPPPAPPRVAAVAPEPPPRPAPPPVAPTPPPRPAPEPRDAEAIPAPEPPRRPVETPRRPEPPRREARAEPADDMPTPPPRPRIETRALPKPEAKPEPKPPREDQVAKLIEAKRADKPDETQPSRFSAESVRNAIARERPQQRAAAAPAPSQTAALGSPTARAERMSPSMWGQLDGYLQEQYRNCWNKFGFDGQTYIPQIRVLFNADGSLAAEPVLVNTPGDVSEKALADSALRAVRRCDPVKIPPQYAPYHAQWRARTLRFDPQEM